ncbi:MAG: hypothetical protein KDD38_03565 [Bdellovibrionales bacterium]|nr:hypothetical protein [Bdellovibrionales bacterium]
MQKKAIAIISDSFAGLILATHLERDGHSVTLIDIGDCLKSQKLRHGQQLPFYPASSELKIALESLNTLIVEPVVITEQELQPLTFEDGTLKPFVGFGDSKSAAVQPLSRLNSSQSFELNCSLQDAVEGLTSCLKTKPFTYSEISKIEFSASKIDKIIINGSQEVIADHYVFLNSPREILDFLPEENLGARVRSRIMKSARWARVALEMQHEKPLFDGSNLIFLIPNQDEQDPCVGQFRISELDSAAPTYHSVWETYINTELSDDAESVANVIKGMRKLIRKAFPDLEARPKEIISVIPQSAADYAWLLDQKDITQVADNLTIYPATASSHLGIAQSIMSAHAAYLSIQNIIYKPSVDNASPSLLAGDASC